jgi:hypothetical protein
MIKNPNDLKEIASALAEINSIIWTDVAENSRQAKDYQAIQEQSTKQNSKLQEFKDEFSKMMDKSRELVLKNTKKAKEANNAWTEEQKKSWAEAENSLAEWPDISEKKS